MSKVITERVTVRLSELPPELTEHAIFLFSEALHAYEAEKDIAAHLKKMFDQHYGPTWHCIIGHKFGSYVSHEGNFFIYMETDSIGALLFKSG